MASESVTPRFRVFCSEALKKIKSALTRRPGKRLTLRAIRDCESGVCQLATQERGTTKSSRVECVVGQAVQSWAVVPTAVPLVSYPTPLHRRPSRSIEVHTADQMPPLVIARHAIPARRPNVHICAPFGTC